MAQQSKNNGCVWLLLSGVLLLGAFGFVKLLFGATTYVTFAVALLISFVITTRILGKLSIAATVRNGILLFIFFFGLHFFGNFFLKLLKTIPQQHENFAVSEAVQKSKMVEGTDTISVYTSNRFWKDNYGNEFSGDLTIRERDFLRLIDHTKNYVPPSGGNFWGGLYDHIDRNDTPSLDLVLATFEGIHRTRQLNTMQFAEMVVSCIQDIPYSFVFQDICRPAEYYEEAIAQILRSCPECCIGNVRYGVQTPVAFLQNLKGDCDTRTVLIYSVLKHFNYDIAILNSDFYKHSILGINIPASGAFKIHNGKKYMLWETTAKYYEIGSLPYNFNDISHWNVVLTSK